MTNSTTTMGNYHDQRASHDAAWRVFEKERPDMAFAIMHKTKPVLNDLSKIRVIYNAFKRSEPFCDPSTAKIVFVAIVLKLYSPATLLAPSIKTKRGICPEIAGCLKSPSLEVVSQLISQARAYMNIKSFREKVEILVKEVGQIISI